MRNLFIELLRNSKHKKINNLYTWLQPIAIGNMIELETFDADDSYYYVLLHFYTSKYKYTIVANSNDYLGCTSTCRSSLPGEDWYRGHDLPDGSFNASTWNKILNGIVRNETEQISKYITEEKYKSFETFLTQLGGGINICSASIL